MSEQHTIEEIAAAAGRMRKSILGLAIQRGGCYLGQACSSSDLIAALYMGILNLGPSLGSMDAQPFPGVPAPDNMDYPKGSLYHGEQTPERDRFFVSPAHYASVIYCALVESGRLGRDAIEKFNVDGWNMEMIGAEHSPGFECTAGSLGQTISIACGTAHARKMKGHTGKVYLLLSDGEMQEGQVWEALQAASFYKLDNLVIYVDFNGQQVEGRLEDVMNMEPFADRLTAFGCTTVTVDGHNIQAVIDASKTAHPNGPLVVLCKTDATTGVPLLEKRKPFLHFVGIGNDERDAFQTFYDAM